MPILKAKAPESTPEPTKRPMTQLLVQFASGAKSKPNTRASDNDFVESGASTPMDGSRRGSFKEVDLANNNKPGSRKGSFSDRAFVEDHVKNALNEGKMKKRGLGGGASTGSSSSSLGSSTDVHKYISIALLLMTMVVGMIVLFIDIDGLDAFYDLMESSPSASYVIFLAMFGVPVILVILISRGMCQKRNDFLRRTGQNRTPAEYDKPYMVNNFDPNHSPISGVMDLDPEMLSKDHDGRSLDGMPFEGEDDQSAVADHYL